VRRRYIQIKGELVEVTPDYVPEPRADIHIMPDIKPYRSMADGSMITSRSKHREHLKVHNCIEIGNETKHLQPKPITSPPGLKDAIIQATEQVLSRRR
jgi:hypothetical protein